MASLSCGSCVVGIRRKVKYGRAEKWILWIRARSCKWFARHATPGLKSRRAKTTMRTVREAVPPGSTPCKPGPRTHTAEGRGYLIYRRHRHTSLYVATKLFRTTRPPTIAESLRRFFVSHRGRGKRSWRDRRALHEWRGLPAEDQENTPTLGIEPPWTHMGLSPFT